MSATLAGRLIGRLRDTGVTNSLIKRVQQELGPGMSALLIYAYSASRSRTTAKIAERLQSWHPQLLETDMPPELEQELRAMVEAGSAGG